MLAREVSLPMTGSMEFEKPTKTVPEHHQAYMCL